MLEDVGKPVEPVPTRIVLLAKLVGTVSKAVPPLPTGTVIFADGVGNMRVPVAVPVELTITMEMARAPVPEVPGIVVFRYSVGSTVALAREEREKKLPVRSPSL